MDQIVFDDPFIPVPSAALEADATAAVGTLLGRVTSLERDLVVERARAQEALQGALLDLITLADEVTTIIEKRGVVTNAGDAVMIRAMIALGRQIIAMLRRHGVEQISTIGKPLDPATSDLATQELRDNLRPGTVLREAQIGYAWKHGVLRRAQVVVSTRPDAQLADVKPDEA